MDSKAYIESDILLAMITSTEFMTYIKDPLEIAFKNYSNDFIQSKEAETAMRWVLEYFNENQRAPKQDLQMFVEPKLRKIQKEDQSKYKLIATLLQTLSECSEEIHENEMSASAQWKVAREYFNIRRAQLLSQQLKDGADNNDESYIQESFLRYNKTEETTSTMCNHFTDMGVTQRAHQQRAEPLIQVPGALGRMIKPHMIPGGFISFLANDKKGKSWFLLYLQMLAAKRRIPTVMVQCGDMSEDDIDMRLGVYLTKRSNDPRFCKEIYVPVLDCAHSQSGECRGEALVCPGKENAGEAKSRGKKKMEYVKSEKFSISEILKQNKNYSPCTECMNDMQSDYKGAVYWRVRPKCEPLCQKDHMEAKAKFIDRYKLTNKSMPIMFYYSAQQMGASELFALSERLKAMDKIPKIWFIDYIDQFKAEAYKNDFRQSQYDTWKTVRGFAQETNSLVITATQANAAAYQTDVLDESHFSEDKRKNAVITALFGLNQTPREKEMGIMRINTILAREGYFDKRRTVSILQCLQMGQPVLGSFDT